MTLGIRQIKPLIGGEFIGGRGALQNRAFSSECLQALEEHAVLVARGAALSDAEQLELTGRLGSIVNFVQRAPGGNTGDFPDVYKISLDKSANPTPEYVEGTFFWHMDGLTSDVPVPRATVLTSRRLSPRGGQTEFSNTCAAYEELPRAERSELEGLRVLHALEPAMLRIKESPTNADLERWRAAPIKEHTLVRTYPSGRKALVIGSSAWRVVGMSLAEGRALLERLVQWASHPDFCYRHDWQLGDLVMWDNYGALHRVVPYEATSGRLMHRTTVGGMTE